MIKNNTTQEARVLEELQKANGEWINGQYFLRTMLLSQYHRAIWNLQNKRERYNYSGEIQASDFSDDYGFKSYKLAEPVKEIPIKEMDSDEILQASLL